VIISYLYVHIIGPTVLPTMCENGTSPSSPLLIITGVGIASLIYV